MVAVRTKSMRVLAPDGELEALRMLTDRRDELTRLRVQTVNRLQRLLAELIPGQPRRDLSALQAKAMLAGVRPRDISGNPLPDRCRRTRRPGRGRGERSRSRPPRLKVMVKAHGSRLMDLHGVGPVVAARPLADVGDVARFPDRNRFASWTGTAPLDASSGEQIRHRLPAGTNG
jgi:transposase